MQKEFIFLVMGFLLLLGCINALPDAEKSGTQNFTFDNSYPVGKVIDNDIQSPHPYPSGTSPQSQVWSTTISHSGVQSLRIHFKKIELKTKAANSLSKESDTSVMGSIAGLELHESNNFNETSQTLKMRTEGVDGDYMVIKNRDGEIEMVVFGACSQAPNTFQSYPCYNIDGTLNSDGFWSASISGDTAIISIFADNMDELGGVWIDQYSYSTI